jgi:hypothetical protein
VLAKASGTDYDTEWVSPGAASEITGLIEAGTNVTLTGAGTSASPYVINASGGGGSGTVTSVSVTTANGVSGSVANATTTPAITITLGAITPTSVNGVVLSGSSTPTLAVTGTASVSGTNTGNQTITLTGDVTGTGTGTFAATIANGAVTLAKMADVSSKILIGRHANNSGTPQQVSVGDGIEFSGSGIQRSAFTGGDVTAAAGSASLTIANDAVTFAKMANLSDESKLIGRGQGAFGGDPQEITLGANLTMTGATIAVDAVESNTNSKIVIRSATGQIFVSNITATGGDSAILLGSGSRIPATLTIAASDTTTAITAGTAKVSFRMPYAMTLSAVRANVSTAPTGSTIIIDINEGDSPTSILSTKLTIDATEKTSTTAATAPVISDTSLADDALITIDFDQVGSTIAGVGVIVTLIGTRTLS